MPKINVNGVDLHYIAFGHGANLVFVHGFLGNLAVWHLQIAPQLRKFYRVTTYDLRGHGYSEMPPTGYTAREMANDLVGLMDALGIEKPVLVGHSFGADIAMYVTLKHPERVEKLVALEPGLAALVPDRKRKEWEGWSHWAAKLEEAGQVIPADKRADVDFLLEASLNTVKVHGPARGLPRNRAPLLRLLKNTTLIRDYEDVSELTLDAVKTIKTPTLLVYGENSHFLSSYNFLKTALPNCTPVLLPGGEHFGPLEQPEALTRLISDFAGPAVGPALHPAGWELPA
jgi:pimeloyl-ACP methyl ester carboxylesterase